MRCVNYIPNAIWHLLEARVNITVYIWHFTNLPFGFCHKGKLMKPEFQKIYDNKHILGQPFFSSPILSFKIDVYRVFSRHPSHTSWSKFVWSDLFASVSQRPTSATYSWMWWACWVTRSTGCATLWRPRTNTSTRQTTCYWRVTWHCSTHCSLVTASTRLSVVGYSVVTFILCKNDNFLYSAVSSPQDSSKHFTLYFPDRPVHWDTISASLGSIQPYATINARRLLLYISTTVYSQVLVYIAEWTGAM